MCSNSVYAISVEGEIIPFDQFSICMVLYYHISNYYSVGIFWEFTFQMQTKSYKRPLEDNTALIVSSCNFFLSYTILHGASCDEIRARLIRVYFPRNHPFMATKNNNERKIFSTNAIWLFCLKLDFLSQYHQINSSNSRDEQNKKKLLIYFNLYPTFWHHNPIFYHSNRQETIFMFYLNQKCEGFLVTKVKMFLDI